MNTLFRNKAFLIVTGLICCKICEWIRNMAILYYVMDRTQGSPIAVSLITVLEYAPILFSPSLVVHLLIAGIPNVR